MRGLLCAVVLLLWVAYGGSAFIPTKESIRTSHTPYIAPYRRDKYRPGGWEPFRIAVNGDGMVDDIQNCDHHQGPSNVYWVFLKMWNPTYDFKICDQLGSLNVDDTPGFFRNTVYGAVRRIIDRLLVKRVSGKLRVMDEGDRVFYKTCKGLIPTTEDAESGIPNADVVIYLGLTSSTSPKTEVCRRDAKGRPTVVSIKLHPNDVRGRGEKYIERLEKEIERGIESDSTNTETMNTSSDEGSSGTEVMYKTMDSL
ncbi:uncharacterized protein TM35_000521300 [Trypanosoma theileri]|uniref:Uncharacterized protein n=1 Tax=Trypanosoma theileri TaxID=67003 RepID=A0A1X0NH10_9TRYP|nr:uncharacterized protein TM35_000521300 [Trypanosoma theileri]ORC83986.1 hypothetical protein TM35_000521300 [Trypanosoma theileri]